MVAFMNRIVFLLSVFLVSFSGEANEFEITISGNFPGAEGREIRLLEYGDLITFREIPVTSAVIDDNGDFSFTFSRFEESYVFFRIDYAKAGIFVQPGQKYFLQWDRVDFDQLDDRINPHLNPLKFTFELTEEGSSLNQDINEFEEEFFSLLKEKFVTIQTSRNVKMFNDIKLHTDTLFEDVENQYFRDYYRYTYGFYTQVANLSRFETLVREYFVNQPVLYNNTQYMDLFNTLFDTYIFAGSRSISNYDLRYTINELNSYHALMDSLGKDTLLRNEVFRELVMLKGLQDMEGNPDYRPSNVNDILSWVKENSKFPQHRVIAENILFKKMHLREGTDLPAFALIDEDTGTPVNIPGDYQGKYLYIAFWASWCENCMLDFIALQQIYQEHEEDLAIVTISTDRYKEELSSFLEQQNFPWRSFHFDNNFQLLDTYQVRGLPLYVLADRNGKVLDFPARRPTGELKTFLERLLHQERNPRR